MSNTIRYDSLLVRHLSTELQARLAGQPVLELRYQRENRTIALRFEGGMLRWSMTSGPQLDGAPDQDEGAPLVLPRRARIENVDSIPDERVLRINLRGGTRANAVNALVIELLPPHGTVVALDNADRVLKEVLPSAARRQTRGQPYRAPSSRERMAVDVPLSLEVWLELLAITPPAERQNLLIRRVAWLSPINAAAVLGNTNQDLASAHARYVELVRSTVRPCVLRVGDHLQPYGHPLWQEAEPCDSLLAAFAQANAVHLSEPDPLRRLEEAITREQRKRERLLQEYARAAETATRLRSDADLLLANAHTVKRGTGQIQLTDFDGRERNLELDPSLTALENAQAWHAVARKRARAAERLPGLIVASEATIREQEIRLARARAGEVVALPSRPEQRSPIRHEEKLPYRRYRTSGGLEVRVGRSSRANDQLTMHHSRPNDVWLHARDVGGAHVLLRWDDADANPPRRDLEQAAALAALHSKARHSAVAPVDWTRRRYVRKPRGAPPGQVRVERVKTVFVAPDRALLDKLRNFGTENFGTELRD